MAEATAAAPTEGSAGATAKPLAVRVDVEDLGAPAAATVVSAASQLFTATDPVRVVFSVRGSDEATAEQAEALQALVVGTGVAAEVLPTMDLLGAGEADAGEYLVSVAAPVEPREAARSVALLTSVSLSLEEQAPDPSGQVDPEREVRAAAARQRTAGELAIARRDVAVAAARGFARRPSVVALFQHAGYWSSVERLYAELRSSDDVDLTVVALDSPNDRLPTAAFLEAQGFTAHGPEWLLDHLDEVDAVLLVDPYDEFRPPALAVPELVRHGLRLVHVPYGNGAISGPLMDALLWDLPLQRAAWRTYLTDPAQRRQQARHCRTGDASVRVLGSPKQDRTLTHVPGPTAAAIRAAARGRRTVLWNPHFRTEAGGWSTFLQLAEPLLDRATARDDLMLVVRPHFRLLPQLERAGGEPARLGRALREAAASSDAVWLDESDDYLDAFAASDALVSDLSSLASEYLLTGRPLLYTHRPDGPGPNDAGAYFDAMDRAETWPEVEAFLDRLAAGQDPGAPTRAAAVREQFAYADGRASERIRRDLVASLTAELHLRPEGLAEHPEPAPVAVPAPLPARASIPAPRRPAGGGLADAVVLSSYGGAAAACSPLAIAEELARQGHPATRYFAVRDASVVVPAGSHPVVIGTPEHAEALATSRWVVDNDAMPAHLRKAPGQVFVQTWHGTPLKKLRRDLHAVAPRAPQVLAECERDAASWDWTLSPNPFTTTVLRRGFRVTGRILESGYPRNDVLSDPARSAAAAARVRAAHGIPAHHRVVLHAPTWRDDALSRVGATTRYRAQPDLDWALVRTLLGPDVTFLHRSHRFLPPGVRSSSQEVVDVTAWPDMTDLLAAADVLVTDYSSSLFDFAVTGRPMVFWAYDLDRYRRDVRGHYLDMEDVVPGPVVTTAAEVAEALHDVEQHHRRHAERYARFRETYAPWDDGRAAERVVATVFS